MGFALQKCENDCDTHCNLPLQGLDADNCHAVTAGFYDANKVVIVMECDDNMVVCVCGQTENDEDQGGYCTSDGRQPASTRQNIPVVIHCSACVKYAIGRLDTPSNAIRNPEVVSAEWCSIVQQVRGSRIGLQ
jgi:hypothetical protein